MASQRFILLVNNIIIRDYDNSPVFEYQESGKKFYSNSKGDKDLTDVVDRVIGNIVAEESNHPLIEVVESVRPLSKYNREFKMKMFVTPLYELQVQLANKPGFSRVAGKDLDVGAIWEENRLDFYVMEFLKYTQIMDYLENMVKIHRPKSSPFSIKHGDNRMMNVLYVKVNGLFNPLDTVTGLSDSKLFKGVFQEEPLEVSIEQPTVFPVTIMAGSTQCYFATSSDILAMCNIKHREAISSRDIYRLVAGIYLKSAFLTSIDGVHEGLLNFPINKTWYSTREIGGPVVEYFTDINDAAESAKEQGLEVAVVDTDASFIASAFKSFKGKPITQENTLLHEIRGAEFVY